MENLKLFKNFNYNEDLIINKHFIFIQIPKTGSTSILFSCKKIKNLTRSFTCYRHEGINYLLNTLSDEFKNKDIYTTVRNPFSQIVSWYVHVLRGHNANYLISKKDIENFKPWLKKTGINDIHIKQNEYLLIDNKLPKNLKFFKFEDGIENVIKYLNNKHNLNMDCLDFNKAEYGKFNYKQFYDNESIQLVLKERKLDFELFNYNKNI